MGIKSKNANRVDSFIWHLRVCVCIALDSGVSEKRIEIGQINSGAFGVHIFGQTICTHFGTIAVRPSWVWR